MTTSPAPKSDQKEAMSLTNRDPNSESPGVSMDLMSLARLMVRHWRVTAPAAAVTLMLVVAVFLVASPTYTSGASVVLFSPRDAPQSETPGADPAAGENPFTRYGDLSVVADIVARKMNSDQQVAALKAEGVTGYTVVANRLQRGPVIDVTGTGPNAAAAIGSAEAVVAKFESVLSELQEAEGADPAYFITSAPVEPPETATAQVGSTLRTAIAALAVGGLGTLGLAVAAEAFTRRRAGASGAVTVAAAMPDVAADPATETADDHPQAQSGTGRPAVWPIPDPADDRTRPPARGGRAAKEASGQAHDGPRRSSGGGRAAATKSGDSGADAQADGSNGSRPGGRRVAAVPAADRPEGKQPGWTIWRPSSMAFAPDNGHEKPATEHKS